MGGGRMHVDATNKHKLPSAGFLVFQIQATNNINEKEAIARDYTNAVLEAAANETCSGCRDKLPLGKDGRGHIHGTHKDNYETTCRAFEIRELKGG